MPGTLILHDTRLGGYPAPASADTIVTVDGNTPLNSALGRIQRYAQGRHGLNRMSIMCHGFEKIHESPSQRQSVMIGGTGLQLCREGLRHHNVSNTSTLEGLIGEIVVYACGAADTHQDMVGTRWDGRRLFGEMAIYTGAVIFAADVTQWYFRRHRAEPNMSTDVIDFDRWEGNLWRFDPDGSPPIIVQSNPLRHT